MYFDRRLWELTVGLRGRIALAILLGLLASVFGIARFALLGALLARVFEGAGFAIIATLAIWIVFSASSRNQRQTADFEGAMVVGSVASLGFVVARWVSLRREWGFLITLIGTPRSARASNARWAGSTRWSWPTGRSGTRNARWARGSRARR